MRARSIFAAACIAATALAAGRAFRSYAAVQPVLNAMRDRLPAALKNPDEGAWNTWSHAQDKAIRARLDQGELDSMVNLLLRGTSFTKQPRIRMEEITAASKSGVLRARVDDLAAGLRDPGSNERLKFLSGFLRGQGVDPSSAGSAMGEFIYKNLLRVLEENKTLAARAAEDSRRGKQSSNQNSAALLDRNSLFYDRGVSLDTSILPDFSIEQTLRDLKSRGIVKGPLRRVAVVGPGLDFIDKNEASGYDYYPQQTLQPFAFYDSLVRLGLAKPGELSVDVFDISSRVLDHLQHVRERARGHTGYVVQLPRDSGRQWPPDLIAYWKTLGDQVGAGVPPIRPPQLLRGLETRAVSIRPDVVLACQPMDLNIIVEALDLDASARFDLIVGTNIFVYYDAFEQALALENAGAMLRPGGLLLTNDRLPEVAGGSMHLAGITRVQSPGGPLLDAVGWYQKH